MSAMASLSLRRVMVALPLELAEDQEPGAHEVEGHVIDLSMATRRSLELGAELSGDGGQLMLVHATPTLNGVALYGGPEGAWLPQASVQEYDRRARERASRVMHGLAEEFCPGRDVMLSVRAGEPAEVILQAAEEFRPDAVVVATSGRSRVRRFFLGSTADRVIRDLRCAVLVIPAEIVA